MNLKLADYFNIPLFFNLFTIPFALFIYFSQHNELGRLALALYVFSLFFVLLHEYAHCFMARRFGWLVKDITILPLGCVARIHFKYNIPKEEICVAIAGPLLNLAIMLLLLPVMILLAINEQLELFFVTFVMVLCNFMICAFNLLPVYPMDGGRILRAYLSRFMGHLNATWWAVRTGQLLGGCLSVFAFMHSYYMAAIIFLIMIVLGQNELTQAKIIALLYKIREEICLTLNKPELARADLPELIAALEEIQDEEIKQKLETDHLIFLLNDLRQSKISI